MLNVTAITGGIGRVLTQGADDLAKGLTTVKPGAALTTHMNHLSAARTLFDDVSLKALQGVPHADVSSGWRELARTVQRGVDTGSVVTGSRGITLDKAVAAAKRLEVGAPRARDMNTIHAAIGNAKANAVANKVAAKIEKGIAARQAGEKIDPKVLAAGNEATAVIRQGEHLQGVAPGQRFAATDKYLANATPVKVVDFGVTGSSKGAAITHAPPFSKDEIVAIRGLNDSQAAAIHPDMQFFTR